MVCRSRKGAWIEIIALVVASCCTTGRSRKGAWIEIEIIIISYLTAPVAPARERGLKFSTPTNMGESRIVAPARERGLKLTTFAESSGESGRSRKGAWIEIKRYNSNQSSQKRRSRKGAWIEMQAPDITLRDIQSLPQGSVD